MDVNSIIQMPDIVILNITKIELPTHVDIIAHAIAPKCFERRNSATMNICIPCVTISLQHYDIRLSNQEILVNEIQEILINRELISDQTTIHVVSKLHGKYVNINAN